MSHLEVQAGSEAQVRVERWPTEIPLLVAVIVAAAGLWILFTITVIGLLYGALIALFLFVSHVGFVAYLRGSAVRLGPEQFPELHARVLELARRIGLRKIPEVYMMQAGGSLNALATGFLRSHMVVLFSDLLEACEDNEPARDMIIGHELGHIRAGHLFMRWFLFPGFLVPFLGTAYSRAREYTCDRYGAAVCGDMSRGLMGLGILAAGGAHGRRVNLRALAGQREQLNTGLMTIGKWLSTHPQLSERIVALDPRMVEGRTRAEIGVARALAGMAAVVLVVAGMGALFVRALMPAIREALATSQVRAASPPDPALVARVNQDLDLMVRLALHHREARGSFPEDPNAFRDAWELSHPEEDFPVDPYDGKDYGYDIQDDRVYIWSSGPDGLSNTDDDITIDSSEVRF
ncbi:MAG: M48 family metallopeptidase [Candidatus Polarisedimenticolia bacterium]